VGYPEPDAELVVWRGAAHRSPDRLTPVLAVADVARLAALTERVTVHDGIYDYIRRIAASTRRHPDIRLGLSPRGCVALARAARAYALAASRPYAVPEDVKTLAQSVCAHRLLLAPDAALRGRGETEVMSEILGEVAVPTPEAAVR
jgi:MoxR-like ATPase